MLLMRLSFSHIPLRFLSYLLSRLDPLCHLKVLCAGSHMAQQILCRKKSNEQISGEGLFTGLADPMRTQQIWKAHELLLQADGTATDISNIYLH